MKAIIHYCLYEPENIKIVSAKSTAIMTTNYIAVTPKFCKNLLTINVRQSVSRQFFKTKSGSVMLIPMEYRP